MKIFILSLSLFVLLVSFQNCSQVSEVVPTEEQLVGVDNNNIGGGEISCQAIPIPHMRLGFLFGSADAQQNQIPSVVEFVINNQVVYSDCVSGPQLAMVQRVSPSRLEFYQEFLDDNAYSSMDMKLYKLQNCSSGSKTEVFSANEVPNYVPNEMCGKTTYKLEVDYLVN